MTDKTIVYLPYNPAKLGGCKKILQCLSPKDLSIQITNIKHLIFVINLEETNSWKYEPARRGWNDYYVFKAWRNSLPALQYMENVLSKNIVHKNISEMVVSGVWPAFTYTDTVRKVMVTHRSLLIQGDKDHYSSRWKNIPDNLKEFVP